ncbi:MAG: SDR family NAD(P)-dependent oxidoreductase [Ignavibacteria bacterium]|jgi:3-oxoacyl-[acyl-carrier protein] reductase|nr:SDR family NAD(P)-dependent oxidoreductase [Ignavibacteria bacterium]MDH7526718.1 SDR family NAD(P)-dependent oxidoreductase [Ignavibacteria bacterium]
MSELNNKNVFISGLSKGIGKAIAVQLAKEGCNIFGVARNESDLKKLEDELSQFNVLKKFFPVDVGDFYKLRDVLDNFLKETKIDILVNNAGIGMFKNLVDYTYEEFDRLIKTNLYGVFNLTRLILPSMIERKNGDIVFISSLAGKNVNPGGTGYSATKFALTGFAHSLMLEVRQYNIRVCLVHPGSVDTDLIGNFNPNIDRDKILKPEDVAEGVLAFLRLPRRAMLSEFEIRPTNPK